MATALAARARTIIDATMIQVSGPTPPSSAGAASLTASVFGAQPLWTHSPSLGVPVTTNEIPRFTEPWKVRVCLPRPMSLGSRPDHFATP